VVRAPYFFRKHKATNQPSVSCPSEPSRYSTSHAPHRCDGLFSPARRRPWEGASHTDSRLAQQSLKAPSAVPLPGVNLQLSHRTMRPLPHVVAASAGATLVQTLASTPSHRPRRRDAVNNHNAEPRVGLHAAAGATNGPVHRAGTCFAGDAAHHVSSYPNVTAWDSNNFVSAILVSSYVGSASCSSILPLPQQPEILSPTPRLSPASLLRSQPQSGHKGRGPSSVGVEQTWRTEKATPHTLSCD